jgi:hypothetical protein
MDWPFLPGVGAEPCLPESLKREAQELNLVVEAIGEERVAADKLGEAHAAMYREDAAHDGRPHFAAVTAVLQRELELRERIETYFLARRTVVDEMRAAAKDRLVRVGERIKQRLGLDENQPAPLGALQADPAWWAARREVAAIPTGDFPLREFENGRHHAIGLLDQYERLTKSEPRRLRELGESRAEAAKREEMREKAEAERIGKRNGVLARINHLLGRDADGPEALADDEPRGRKRRTPAFRLPVV